jgi:hypothetical protein
MNEVIIEGLDESDFITLKCILETYPITLNSSVSVEQIKALHKKVADVVAYLEGE